MRFSNGTRVTWNGLQYVVRWRSHLLAILDKRRAAKRFAKAWRPSIWDRLAWYNDEYEPQG
jgi:hypothetical protein